jgi:hypothetical protein
MAKFSIDVRSTNGEKQKKFLLLTMLDEVKGAVFPENRMWDYKLAFDEQVTNLYFEQRKKHKKFGTKNCSFDGF